MGAKTLIKKVFRLGGFSIHKLPPDGSIYDQDGLRSAHNHDFMTDPSFRRAYERGVSAVGSNYRWHWRVHVGLWTAYAASKLEGDFVECGVNRGFLSSAIMEYLNWDSLDKTFYLLDTFSGLDERYVPDEELKRRNRHLLQSGFYTTDLDSVRRNFSQWENVRIIVGSIPDTLDAVETESVAYLHLDMNCAPPEVAALQYLWNRIVPGGFVLLDDYAYGAGCGPQKAALDGVAAAKDLQILSLPTGQGLLVKPV